MCDLFSTSGLQNASETSFLLRMRKPRRLPKERDDKQSTYGKFPEKDRSKKRGISF